MDQPDRDKLREPFPPHALRTRKVDKGRRELSYVEGHTVIHRLNNCCPSWDFAIKEISTSPLGTDREGNEIVLVRAHVALTLPGLGTREHIGVQSVYATGGEDLVKGAVTDALKKAATLFGVGLELYGPDYEAGELPEVVRRPPPSPPPRAGDPARRVADEARQRFRQSDDVDEKIAMGVVALGMDRIAQAADDGSPPDPKIADWTAFWEWAKGHGVRDADQYAELTERKPGSMESPQHAFNLLKKKIGERDGALARTS